MFSDPSDDTIIVSLFEINRYILKHKKKFIYLYIKMNYNNFKIKINWYVFFHNLQNIPKCVK